MRTTYTAQELLALLPRHIRYRQLQGCGHADRRPLRSLCVDSRRAGEDSLFICLCGFMTDGHEYAAAAYAAGCRCFVICHALPTPLPEDAYVYLVDDTREAQAQLAEIFYDYPSKALTLVGITGTKGKTTTAMIAYSLLCRLGVKAGYIGTDGVRYGTHHEQTRNTTPDSPELRRIFRDMADRGVRVVVMEISSQSVWQKRLLGLRFAVGAFTNLSPDHISPTEHPDFEHYFACKHAFLTDYCTGTVLLNADDAHTAAMGEDIFVAVRRFSTGAREDGCADELCPAWSDGTPGMAFTYWENSMGTPVHLPMPGAYNVSNALCALGIIKALGYAPTAAIPHLRDVTVPGRFELAPAPRGCLCIIDYAHNGMSLTTVLRDLRTYTEGRLLCLVGSVGGRTQLRRRDLGEAAATLADLTVFTADTPDREDPEDICREMAQVHRERGLDNYVIIPDRAEAIRAALRMMHEGDVLLLAGKGSERYQRVDGVDIPFSERDILAEAVADILPV